MKKRFLSILLTTALVLSGEITTTPLANAATISDSVKQSIPTMSDEELIELLESEHAKNPEYGPTDTQDIAELCNKCRFETDSKTIKNGTMEGAEILWLNPAEVEILRARFPERFAGITATSICLQAGVYGEDEFVINEQLIKRVDDPWTYQPNFEGIVEMLSRGPYTIKLTGSVSSNCTKNVKVSQKYTATANYKLTASDGGDLDATDIRVSIDYNRKKPTKLKVICNLLDQEFSKTITLKMSASLQKKIKAGKVVISGSNCYTYGSETAISVYKNTTAKSGKINLAFKFKTKK